MYVFSINDRYASKLQMRRIHGLKIGENGLSGAKRTGAKRMLQIQSERGKHNWRSLGSASFEKAFKTIPCRICGRAYLSF